MKKELNLNFLLKRCLEEWNTIVANFLTLPKEKIEQINLYRKRNITKYKKNKDKNESANMYLTVMERVIERENGFVFGEQKRNQHILDNGKIKEKTKNGMKIKLNILTTFV